MTLTEFLAQVQDIHDMQCDADIATVAVQNGTVTFTLPDGTVIDGITP